MLVIAMICGASAPEWLHLYYGSEGSDIKRVRSVRRDSIARITHTRSISGLPYDSLQVTYPSGNSVSFPLEGLEACRLRTQVPTIFLQTDSMVDEIPSKEYYLKGTFSMSEGLGTDSVAPIVVNIKGRGNTTWNLPKKPYRLKFDKKLSLCGLQKAKSYALIANYIDATLMHNAAAFEMARMMGCPYTNHSIPVNVVLNGVYRGSYMLTEKIGMNSGSVDIDETQGAVLLELDENMDEAYCFYSPQLRLPVMVKDPDLDELAEEDTTMTAAQRFERIKADFIAAEQTLKGDDDIVWKDYFDINSAVNYLLIYNVMGNWDLNYPRSVYIHRPDSTSKYVFGPIWDFDWSAEYMEFYEPLITEWNILDERNGGYFFYCMASKPSFRKLYRQRWDYFKNFVWPELKEYLEQYANAIEASAYINGEKWSMTSSEPRPLQHASSETFRARYNVFIDWLQRRIDFIDLHPNYAIY